MRFEEGVKIDEIRSDVERVHKTVKRRYDVEWCKFYEKTYENLVQGVLNYILKIDRAHQQYLIVEQKWY